MYQPIVSTLGYVLSPDRLKVLLVHRNRRPDDHHFGKYNGLGGKMIEGEEIAQAMRREIYEEAGITCQKMRLKGTINWPGFGKKGEHWLGFVFVIDSYEGTPRKSNEEGELTWVPITEIEKLPMWDGDKYFLPLIFDENPELFHALIPYEGGKPTSFTYSRT